MKKRLSMIFLLTAVSAVSALAFTVGNLRVQSLRNPSGIDVLEPQFSWQLQSEGRGVMQTTYQLVVTTDAKGQTIITSATAITTATTATSVQHGKPLVRTP